MLRYLSFRKKNNGKKYHSILDKTTPPPPPTEVKLQGKNGKGSANGCQRDVASIILKL